MNRLRVLPAALIAIAVAGGTLVPTGVRADPIGAEAPPAKDTPPARFKALYEREWAWRQEQEAGADDEDGPGAAADHLPKVDPDTQDARTAYWQQVMAELDAIDRGALDAPTRIDFDVYRNQIATLLDQQRYRAWEMPFNSDTAFWSDLGFTARGTFRSVEDYRRYLAQLADIPRYFDQQVANMRAGLARGFSQPRVTLAGRDQSIADVAGAGGEDNLFYTPFKDMPASIPAAEQAQLRQQALAAIERSVIPAYAGLLAFMREEYLPKARTTLAAEALPDGKAYYRAQIREFVTEDMDPEQIHRIGLREVARLRGEMQQVMAEVGFKGSFSDFLAFLRTDPQFYARTPQQLLEHAAWIAKVMDGNLGRYFGRVPRQRFTIKPVPDDLAPFYTGGRGGLDTYWLNTWNLPSRPLYVLPALTLHESSPGHSLQMSLAAETAELPEFRRYGYLSAYGEGWALYCEYLGQEMGMYTTPYERFGYLTYQVWRAARLVIDTGVHHEGWSREQALAYLRDNAALSEHEITTEVDRYIAWPGQALSYYLGELKIIELRRKAEQALGAKFDIRNFHDAVLSLGSVPLPVLEARIDQFIAEGGKSPWGEAATGR
ncbi:DUF885 family protein [Stenotrophomonas sp. MMGLT7]|uniref:DUF885 domain-containing protein n=1 Tax=Stenotrophomonas sp. MMGLT7 TaxID=2901227 RepID=UPI001E525893|nr:DUF885 family protein [Stenotrophomonas sp. MMGLT7]MCD7097161.1 DUF885 family protein [Stenotrophomonas sp. MMGLT7]